MAIPLGDYPGTLSSPFGSVRYTKCPSCGQGYREGELHSCYPPLTLTPTGTATADQVSQLFFEMNGRLRDMELQAEAMSERLDKLNSLLYDLLTTLKEIKR